MNTVAALLAVAMSAQPAPINSVRHSVKGDFVAVVHFLSRLPGETRTVTSDRDGHRTSLRLFADEYEVLSSNLALAPHTVKVLHVDRSGSTGGMRPAPLQLPSPGSRYLLVGKLGTSGTLTGDCFDPWMRWGDEYDHFPAAPDEASAEALDPTWASKVPRFSNPAESIFAVRLDSLRQSRGTSTADREFFILGLERAWSTPEFGGVTPHNWILSHVTPAARELVGKAPSWSAKLGLAVLLSESAQKGSTAPLYDVLSGIVANGVQLSDADVRMLGRGQILSGDVRPDKVYSLAASASAPSLRLAILARAGDAPTTPQGMRSIQIMLKSGDKLLTKSILDWLSNMASRPDLAPKIVRHVSGVPTEWQPAIQFWTEKSPEQALAIVRPRPLIVRH